MKIIYNLVFIMLFMIVGNLSTQKISVELGPQIKFDNDRSYPTLLYGDDTGYYIWSKEYGGLFSSKSSSFLEKLRRKRYIRQQQVLIPYIHLLMFLFIEFFLLNKSPRIVGFYFYKRLLSQLFITINHFL